MEDMICELCQEVASVYCRSDSAFLCWLCDARVHGANFLVARHVRHTVCSECKGFTGRDGFSGVEIRPYRPICGSCSPGASAGNNGSISSPPLSSSSSCVSTTDSAPKERGLPRRKQEKTGCAGVESGCRIKVRRSSSVDAKVEGILVNWSKRLGISANCRALASHALAVCLEKFSVLPLRISLAAAIWYGVKLGGGGEGEAYTCQTLKRLVLAQNHINSNSSIAKP